MDNWYNRLKKVREEMRMSQSEFGRAIGKDATQISRYERGAVGKFPKALYRSLIEIMDEDKVRYIENGSENNMVAEADIGYGYNNTAAIPLPYYPDIYASAGGGAYEMLSTVEPISISKDLVSGFLGVGNAKGLHLLNVVGDSMEPTLHNGELIFVNPIENEGFRDGGVYVLICQDTILVKRVRQHPTTRALTLVSDNPNVSDVELSSDDESCRIVGRVIGHMDRI